MSGRPPAGGRVFRLLIMCSANQCRSPMAEVLAVDLLAHHGVDAEVVSCGSMEGGVRASAGAIRAMTRRGLDLSTHLSNQVDAETIEAADLIIVMERRHIGTVAAVSVTSVDRTFTLTELADLATVVGLRRPEVPVEKWIASANAMRHPSAVLAMDTEGDIEDPMGGPTRAYRRTAETIALLLDAIVARMYPLPPDELGP